MNMITDIDPPQHGFPEYTVTFTVHVAAPRPERAALVAWEHLAEWVEWHPCTVTLDPDLRQYDLKFCPSVEEQAGEGQTPYARHFHP